MDILFEEEKFVMARFPCDCFAPDHSLDVSMEKFPDEWYVELTMNSHAGTWWRRLREAVTCLRGREVKRMEMGLRPQDVEALASFLRRASPYESVSMTLLTKTVGTE